MKRGRKRQPRQRTVRDSVGSGGAAVCGGGAIKGGSFMDEAQLQKLRNLPTREASMAKLAGMIKMIQTRLAVSVQAVPQQLSTVVDRVAEQKKTSEATSSA